MAKTVNQLRAEVLKLLEDDFYQKQNNPDRLKVLSQVTNLLGEILKNPFITDQQDSRFTSADRALRDAIKRINAVIQLNRMRGKPVYSKDIRESNRILDRHIKEDLDSVANNIGAAIRYIKEADITEIETILKYLQELKAELSRLYLLFEDVKKNRSGRGTVREITNTRAYAETLAGDIRRFYKYAIPVDFNRLFDKVKTAESAFMVASVPADVRHNRILDAQGELQKTIDAISKFERGRKSLWFGKAMKSKTNAKIITKIVQDGKSAIKKALRTQIEDWDKKELGSLANDLLDWTRYLKRSKVRSTLQNASDLVDEAAYLTTVDPEMYGLAERTGKEHLRKALQLLESVSLNDIYNNVVERY